MDCPSKKVSNEDIQKLIIELLCVWFPMLVPVIENGYVFGGVLREMWAAARSYDPHKSLSLRDTIRYHMFYYFKNGGDVDFQISSTSFQKNSGIYLEGDYSLDNNIYTKDQDNCRPAFKDVISINTTETMYELTRLTSRYNKNRTCEMRDFGMSRDDIMNAEKFIEDLFPSQNFKLEVLADICPELGPAMGVNMDMIVPTSYNNELLTHCDFTCNLLYLSGTHETEPTFQLKFKADNCATLEEYDQLISDKKLRILEPEKEHNAAKLIKRIADRIADSWTIDTEDSTTRKQLVDCFVRAVDVMDYDSRFHGVQPQSVIDQKDKLYKFIHQKDIRIFRIFMAVRDDILTHIIKEAEKSRGRYESSDPVAEYLEKPNYYTEGGVFGHSNLDVIMYIQDLACRNGQYSAFKKWSSAIPYWNIERYSNINRRTVIEYCPELVPHMFTVCPFKTNKDAMIFLECLIEFDREELLRKYLTMSSGKRTIELFNSLGEKKLECGLFRGFFSNILYDMKALYSPKYLEILHSHGMEFPSLKQEFSVLEEKRLEMGCQNIKFIEFMWNKDLINKSNLFPEIPENAAFYQIPDCISPTEANIVWLLDNVDVNTDDIKRMAAQMGYSYDLGFMMEYKKFCIAHGMPWKTFEHVFSKAFDDNDWQMVNMYFQYRFGCDWPDMDQVARLSIKNSKYSSSLQCIITRENIPRLSSDSSSVFQRLVLHYGPHLFIGVFNSDHYGFSNTWFMTVYWLWRIYKNGVTKAFSLPSDIVNKIVELVHVSEPHPSIDLCGWKKLRRRIRIKG